MQTIDKTLVASITAQLRKKFTDVTADTYDRGVDYYVNGGDQVSVFLGCDNDLCVTVDCWANGVKPAPLKAFVKRAIAKAIA